MAGIPSPTEAIRPALKIILGTAKKKMGAVGGLANQSAVFEIWTNQKAVFGSRDRLGREGIFEVWTRVLVGRACAVEG